MSSELEGDLVPSRSANSALRQERREHLVQTATELFLTNGFHKTTVRQIADAAGWNMGTLYLYISRKEDVLYLISESILREQLGSLRSLSMTGDPIPDLLEVLNTLFESVARLRREISLIYRESASLLPQHLDVMKKAEMEINDMVTGIIRAGVDGGCFAAEDPTIAAESIIMLAHMWALKGWAIHSRVAFSRYKEIQITSVLRLLATSSGAD